MSMGCLTGGHLSPRFASGGGLRRALRPALHAGLVGTVGFEGPSPAPLPTSRRTPS